MIKLEDLHLVSSYSGGTIIEEVLDCLETQTH